MEDSCVTYGINRLFYTFSSLDRCLWLLLINTVLLIWTVVSHCPQPVAIGVFLLLNVLMLLSLFIHAPALLSTNGRFAVFDEYVYLLWNLGTLSRGIYFWCKVGYSVTDLYDIEFRQSFIEKIFDIGRISFRGRVTREAKHLDRIKEKDRFTIGGIRHFSSFKLYMEQHKVQASRM